MSNNYCREIIFSDRACNAIVSETFDKVETETGGILLGKIVDDIWYVIEVIDPGPNSIFTVTYFEYDTIYVNHLAKTISKQYETELAVLGLWHRHPGSMDTFSSTDDLTNSEFSKLNSKGAISGIVNIDPEFRLSMFHISLPLKYTSTIFKTGDFLLPANLLTLKFKGNVTFCSGENKEITKTFTKKKGGNRNFLNRIADIFLYRKERKIVSNNDLVNDNDVFVIKNLDEDYLVDLYADEELELENKLMITYESLVKEDRIIYSVKEFINGEKIEFPIFFNVNMDVKNLLFCCGEKDFKFSKGIFCRYVESQINNSEFLG